MKEIELHLMQIIASSGDARSLIFEALLHYRGDEFEDGRKKYVQAGEELIIAKRTHAELLRLFANGEFNEINLLLVHAEDHLNSSEAIYSLANEFFYLYERLDRLGMK